MPHATPIDRLVEWAYIELLKRGTVGTLAQQWDTLRDYGERGWTAIDDERVNADLHMPAAPGPPHVDALTIERAVQGLERRSRSIGRAIACCCSASCSPSRRTSIRSPVARWNEVALVETFARMGSRPKWDIGKPIAQARDGGEQSRRALIGGKLAAKRPIHDGTTCAIRWEPSIERVAQARAEYLVWRKALESLAGTLRAWTLADHVPLRRARRPSRGSSGDLQSCAPIGGVAPAWPTWEPDPPGARGEATRAPGMFRPRVDCGLRLAYRLQGGKGSRPKRSTKRA
jgi:hypothetical protein